MSKEIVHSKDLPTARTVEGRRRFPLIWVVPLLAAVVSGYLILQRALESEGTITLLFDNVGGVRPRQTTVHYRGAEIGRVTDVDLAEGGDYAMLEVKLRRGASRVAREGALFWIVRPELVRGRIASLGTLLTGPYIDVLPGKGPPARRFVGLDHSPDVIDPEGLTVVLLTRQGGGLETGLPIYYRGFEVGAVRESKLQGNSTAVEIHGVIRRRYAKLVRPESRFWNVTGLDVRVGLFRGAEFSMESLKSLLFGGIAFATPEKTSGGPLSAGMVFQLHDEPEDEWLEWSPRIVVPVGEGGEESGVMSKAPDDVP
jgi:paraquat-inducible protein B